MTANTLAIPVQGVVAPIDACRIVAGGLEPPADVRRTCYWAGGAPVSSRAGSTVVAGQCDWAGHMGALGRVGLLRAGDTLLSAGTDAQVTRWHVDDVIYRPKKLGILPGAFAGRSGTRRLYLVTCGGPFDTRQQSYRDNVYVLATPAGG